MRVRIKESGAVSLFLVIFSALLITTVTVAFVRIMLQGQQQATTDDLSKSALDSAYAGVEDAKRVILEYRTNCFNSQGAFINSTDCLQSKELLDGDDCKTIQKSGIFQDTADKDEIIIKQIEADEQLQQAYTCVKVTYNTVDVEGVIGAGNSKIISLDAEDDFNTIKIEWFSRGDLATIIANNPDLSSDVTIDLPNTFQLPKLGLWPPNRPPIMRAQLIQFGDRFRLSDFDGHDGEKANAAALFLMPSTIPENNTLSFDDDYLGSGPLQAAPCQTNFPTISVSNFACSATVRIPNPMGPDNPDDRRVFLRINTIYNGSTSYRISLANDDDPVKLNGVQPEVDSTGRANDLFRRISARVEVGASNVPFVNAAVESAGSFCKTFLVTDRVEDFDAGSCNP